MNARALLIVATSALAGVAFAAYRRAPAQVDEFSFDTFGTALVDLGGDIVNQVTQQPANVDIDTAAANVYAFLAALRAAEGTDRQADPYRVVMGYGTTLQNLSDHPYFTGEWSGAYFGNPAQLSTAAGAYQFIRRTWAGLRDKLDLPDFGPDSQDAAAIELIRQRGALEDVKAGRFAQAVEKCRKVWASLPGAGYGQQERGLAWLQAKYENNGGTYA